MRKASTGQGWTGNVKLAKRELLLLAAKDEFAESGLEGATMRGIAVRAGCSTGAIYPLFDSKEDIYAELLQRSLSALDAYVASAVSSAKTPDAEVQAACVAFVTYYLENRFEVNLGLYAFRGVKRQGVGKASDEILNRSLAKVLERIALPLSKVRHCRPVEARPLVALLFSQMIGALVLQMAGRLKFLEIDAQALTRLLLAQLDVVTQDAANERNFKRVPSRKAR